MKQNLTIHFCCMIKPKLLPQLSKKMKKRDLFDKEKLETLVSIKSKFTLYNCHFRLTFTAFKINGSLNVQGLQTIHMESHDGIIHGM